MGLQVNTKQKVRQAMLFMQSNDYHVNYWHENQNLTVMQDLFILVFLKAAALSGQMFCVIQKISKLLMLSHPDQSGSYKSILLTDP